jgi:hypothetical protein
MAQAAFYLNNWSAYCSPHFQGEHSNLLSDEMATNVSFLPPMSRRRMSRLSKLSLRLAQECAPEYQGFAVFGSQHGELVTTQALLESIAQGELVSPAGFSTSVHNTAIGLHSINNKNVFPCTSLAAGRDTLPICFMEAQSLLQNGAEQVLLVYADDAVPEPLDLYIEGDNHLRGFAALLQQGPARTDKVINLSHTDAILADRKNEPLNVLISFLLHPPATGAVCMAGEGIDWRWQYHD